MRMRCCSEVEDEKDDILRSMEVENMFGNTLFSKYILQYILTLIRKL